MGGKKDTGRVPTLGDQQRIVGEATGGCRRWEELGQRACT
jgi:hypothetical protein